MEENVEEKVLEEKVNFNCFVGASTGTLKGVSFGTNPPILKGFTPEKKLVEPVGITSLSWVSSKNKKLLVGYEDGTIRTYLSKSKSFTETQHLDVKSLMVGVYDVTTGEDQRTVYGLQNGKVILYSSMEDKNVAELSTGQNLSVIRQFDAKSSIFATGGEESDLRIWDLNSENYKEPLFKARNVRHDFLELRVPVWVQDLTFVNNSTDLVSICSRHGHVRIYDVREGQRPQVDCKLFDDEGLMAICDTGQSWQVIVGGNKGTMACVDVRYPGKGRLVHKFSAASGSVRSIAFKNNSIAAVGLDRHLYLYNLYEKKAVKKLYLKTHLTKVILTDDFTYTQKSTEEVEEIPRAKRLKK